MNDGDDPLKLPTSNDRTPRRDAFRAWLRDADRPLPTAAELNGAAIADLQRELTSLAMDAIGYAEYHAPQSPSPADERPKERPDPAVGGLPPNSPSLPAGTACQKGCSHCCSLPVVTSLPEVLLTKRYAETYFDERERRALEIKMAAASAEYSAAKPAQARQLRVTCPFLVKGACSVYDVRPLACRGWHSFDVSACIAVANGDHDPMIPQHAPYQMAFVSTSRALHEGLMARGASGPVHLVVGLSSVWGEHLQHGIRTWLNHDV